MKRIRMEFTRYRLAATAVILLGLAWGAGLAGLAIVGQWPIAAARAAGWERVDYRILATKKTSTMQKELDDAGSQGYAFVGLTVAETAMGGQEVVTITRRRAEAQ